MSDTSQAAKAAWVKRVLGVGMGTAVDTSQPGIDDLQAVRGGTGSALRQKVDQLRLALPSLAAKWDTLEIPVAESGLDTFIAEINKIGKEGERELKTDPGLEVDLELLKREGSAYREKVADDRRMFQFIERTASEIVNVLPKMNKPMEIKQRLAFCRSELDQIEIAARRQPARPDFKSVAPRVLELRTALDGVEQQAHARMLKKITDDAAEASEWAQSYTRKLADVGRLKGAEQARLKAMYYGEASKTLKEQMQALGDWGAQIREAAGWLTDTKAMEQQVVRWTESCIEIRNAIEGFLPTLKSRISETPPTAADGGAPLNNPEEVLTKECKKSWVEAKTLYATRTEAMKSLAKWRKDVVDKWLEENLAPLDVVKGPGKGWVSVGSSDPTSDYDISINKHGKKPTGEVVYDFEMVKMFNTYWRGKYGVETGTLFDTNLYAAAPPAATLGKREGASDKEVEALAEVDAAMDVGALMKLRRYMSPSDFQIYRLNTLESYPEGPQRQKIQKQFEESDDNYMISLTVIIDKVREQLKQKVDEATLPPDLVAQRHEAAELLAEWDKKSASYSGMQLAEGAAEMERVAHALEHMSDINLQATNDIYVEQIGRLRKAEADVQALDPLRNEIDTLDPAGDKEELRKKLSAIQVKLDKLNLDPNMVPSVDDPAFVEKLAALKNKDGDAQKTLSDKKIDLLGDLSRQKAMSMFFANEAYQSAGPFKAVVEADQAVEPDVKAAFAESYYKEGGNGAAEKDKFANARADERDDMINAAWKASFQQQEMKDGEPVFKDGKPVFVNTEQGKAMINEERKKRRDAMSPEEVLQSFNEQLGDFLKDLTHYGEDEPGKAIVQSSKYLDRLLEALVLMQKDKGLKCVAEASELGKEVKTHIDLQPRIKKELIGARKGLIKMDPLAPGDEIDQDKERKAYACKFMKDNLGVVSVAELATLYSRLGMRVNAAVRKELAQ